MSETRHFEESGRKMRQFYRSLNEVFTRYESFEETDRGYAFTFPSKGGWSTKIERFRDEFVSRFPAIRVDVTSRPDGGHRVDLAGPEAARQFIERTIAAAHAGSLTLPSPTKERLVSTYRRATSSLRMRPSFLVIGAPRSGTTSLYSYLCEHPQIRSAARKEIGFFDIFYNRGLAFYRSMFPLRERGGGAGTAGKAITGEATPTYLAHPLVPKRVAQAFPNVKLIAMVRNPIERAFSQYHYGLRNGVEDLSFEEAIAREEERLAGELERMSSDTGYFSAPWVYHSNLTTGRYAEHLERWCGSFPREQLLVVGMEAFAADPSKEFRRICEFLEVAPFEPARFEALNAFPYPNLAAGTRRQLEAYFRPHNERLWSFLGTDLGWNARLPDSVGESGT